MGDFSVLVVDDEADFVLTLLKRLKRKGVDSEGVYSGQDAMKKIRDRGFDVVLLDMKLADKNGNEVLREIKEENPGVQVVILSGHASAKAGREGLGYGAFDYLLKPVEFESLYEKLKEAFNERAGLVRSNEGK